MFGAKKMNKTISNIKIGIFLLVILLLVLPSFYASTLVVNSTGTACTTGTNYYNTIQRGIADAVAGDTIIVCSNGSMSYKENVVINVSVNLYGNQSGVWVNVSSTSLPVFNITSNWVNITNFTVSNSTGSSGVYIIGNNSNVYGVTSIKNSNGITLISKNNTLSNNIINSNNNNGLDISSNGNNIIENTANNNQAGIKISSNNNNNLINNTANGNTYGFYLSNSPSNVLRNNVAQENIAYDLYVDPTVGTNCNNIIDNMTGSRNIPINFTNQTVTWSNFEASEILLCNAPNSVINNVTVMGSNLIRNNAFFITLSNNVTVSNSNISNVYSGFNLNVVTNSNLSYNILNNNTYGFYLLGASNSNISFNNVTGATVAGFSAISGSGNTFNNNNLSNNNRGFTISTSPSIITNNTITNSVSYNIYISGNNNNITNNIINQGPYGVYFNTLSNNNFVQNNTINNNTYGFYLDTVNNTNFSNNIIANNSLFGTFILRSDGINLTNEHYYKNGIDFRINNSFSSIKTILNLTNVIFDNPLGNFANYTNLSINDAVDSGTAYSINWSSIPATLPTNTLSFNNKYINISNNTGTTSIDSLTWNWLDSEISGYTESKLTLYKFNSGIWTLLNNTPEVTNNVLSLSNLNPLSIYSVLQDNSLYINSCGHLTTSGSYTLTQNLISSDGSSCVVIDTNNVTIDLNGFSVSNSSNSTSSIAILITGNFQNISIKNGLINNNRVGFNVVSGSINLSIQNVSFINNSNYDIYLINVSYILIDRNNFRSNGSSIGIETSGFYNNITNNTFYFTNKAVRIATGSSNYLIYNNTINSTFVEGISLGSSSLINISNNIIFNTTSKGIVTDSNSPVNYTTINNNIIYNGSDSGLDIRVSNWNNITNNLIYNNHGASQISLERGTNNTITNNILYNGLYAGISLTDTSNSTVYNNSIYHIGFQGNGGIGISLTNSHINNITGNNITNNEQNGFVLYFGNYNTVSSNIINNQSYGIYMYSNNSYNQFINNIINSTLMSINDTSLGNNSLIYSNTTYGSSVNWTMSNLTVVHSITNNEIFIGNNLIAVNSSALPELNRSAIVNISNALSSSILFIRNFATSNSTFGLNSILCSNTTLPSCNNIILSGNNLMFNTSGFSTFETAPTCNSCSLCTDLINTGNNYFILNTSLVSPDGYNCINITGNNIILDLAGFSVSKSTKDNNAAIYVNAPNNNISIINGILNNSNSGIYLNSSSNINISNITSRNNAIAGFYISSSNSNNISNNIIYNNSLYGIFLIGGNSTYNNNIIANSIYNQTTNSSSAGIYLNNVGKSDNFNNIYNNILIDNNTYGIYLNYSNYTNITSNSLKNNTLAGTYSINSYNNIISYITLINNQNTQIFIDNSNINLTGTINISQTADNILDFNIINGGIIYDSGSKVITSHGNYVINNATNVTIKALSFSSAGASSTDCATSPLVCTLLGSNTINITNLTGSGFVNLTMYYDTSIANSLSAGSNDIKISKYIIGSGWENIGQSFIDIVNGRINYNDISSFSTFGVISFTTQPATATTTATTTTDGGTDGILPPKPIEKTNPPSSVSVNTKAGTIQIIQGKNSAKLKKRFILKEGIQVPALDIDFNVDTLIKIPAKLDVTLSNLRLWLISFMLVPLILLLGGIFEDISNIKIGANKILVKIRFIKKDIDELYPY